MNVDEGCTEDFVRSKMPNDKGMWIKIGIRTLYDVHFQCITTNDKGKYNNAITDGGVAPPTILLTIVMMSSNLKSLRISRNSKDSREG